MISLFLQWREINIFTIFGITTLAAFEFNVLFLKRLIMKNLQITRRDVKVFFIGALVMLMIVLIYDWKDFMRGFKDGYNGVKTESQK